MKKRRKNAFGHVVTYYKVAICGAEVPAKSRSPLSKRPVLVRQLSFSAEKFKIASQRRL